MYPYFNVFGLAVPAYGLMMVVGAALGSVLALLRRRRFDASREDTFFVAMLAVVGAVAGAKVLYLIVSLPMVIRNWSIFAEHPELLLNELLGGMVFYGGVIGAFLLCTWYMRRFKVAMRPMLDLFAASIPLAHAAGRVGCFLGGCCYGAAADWGITYTIALPHEANGVPRIPVQLFEAAGNLLICLAIVLYQRKARKSGRGFALYLLLYAPLRFGLEFFRGDAVRGGLWTLSTSQWLSFVFLAVGLYLWLRPEKAKKDRQAGSSPSDQPAEMPCGIHDEREPSER